MAEQTSCSNPISSRKTSLSLPPWLWHTGPIDVSVSDPHLIVYNLVALVTLYSLMVLEVFLTTVFTVCLTSVVSPSFPPRLWVPWGEGKCCLCLWPPLDIHRMLWARYPVCCSAEPSLCGMRSVRHPLLPLGFLPLCLPGISPPVPQEGVSSQIASPAITAKATMGFIRH